MPETAAPPASADAPDSAADRPADAAEHGRYEGMFVFDSADFATDGEEFVGRVAELIERADGVVEAHRMWVDGRLAYPIRNKRKGVHYIVLFTMPPAKVKDFDRTCRLEDRILRHMVIRPPAEIYDVTLEVVNPSEEPAEAEDGEIPVPA